MKQIPSWLDQELPLLPSIRNIEGWLQKTESVSPVRNNLETKVYFADARKKNQTDTAILYIHGYSASVNETQPLSKMLAKKLRANVVMLRVARHGISLAPMEYLSPELWYYSALQGLAIANVIGKKVLVISCSTGGTLSLLLSARKTVAQEMHQQVLISPNCWPHPKLSTWLFLTPLHTVLEKLPTIPILGKIMSPGDGNNPELSPHIVYETQSELHAQNNTLRVPTTAIKPMMLLVQLIWTIKKKAHARYVVPTFVLASSRDREVIYNMTVKFFKNFHAPHTMKTYNDSSAKNQHVLAGNMFAPESTSEVVDIIFEHIDKTLKYAPSKTKKLPARKHNKSDDKKNSRSHKTSSTRRKTKATSKSK